MDRRRQPRFTADQKITVTILSGTERTCEATVKSLAGNGLGLEVATPINSGAALKIELDAGLVLGEVVYCRPVEGHFNVGVQLSELCPGLTCLAHQVEQFQQAESRKPLLGTPR
jgi:hypothetical protein